MKKLDREIKSILNQKLEIPEKYNDMIYYTLRNLPDKENLPVIKRNKLKLSFATICCILLLTTSVVFASEITEFVKNIFNYSRGIDKAIENGYIENSNIETVKSNGTTITAKNFLMDDFNLSFTFDVKLENEEVLKTSNIEFLDMIITDEENNILYCEDEERFNEYCKNNNLNYTFSKYNEKYIDTGMNKYIKSEQKDETSIIYNLYANMFPRSENLYIYVSKIKCLNTYNNKEVILEGNWNIELDVPEKFYNRECAIYTVTYCSEPEINVTDIAVYNTGTKFEFTANFQPIYNEQDIETVKEQKMDEFTNWYMNQDINDKRIVNNEYIEDEKGNKYYPIKNNIDDKNIQYKMNGEFNYSQIFDLTKYEDVNKIKIHFNLNLPYENKDIVIELERNM